MAFFTDTAGEPRGIRIAIVAAAALLCITFLIGFIGEFFAIVPPSHKGLVIEGGKLKEQVLNDGFAFKQPFWTDIVPVYIGMNTTDTGDKKEELDGRFVNIRPLSKDGQVMEMDVQINYTISDPVKFRRETGASDPKTIENLLFVPTVRRLSYDYVSEYTWKNLIQGGDRQELGQRLFRTMASGEVSKRLCSEEKKTLDPNTKTEIIVEAGCTISPIETISKPADFGVVVTAVNVRKISPNQNIIAAVEEAQKKEQEVKIAEQEKLITKQNADKLIEEKRGQTDSRKLEVAAEAYKLQIEAEAKAKGVEAEAGAKKKLAEAERELANALKGSGELINYKRLDIENILAQAQLEFAKHYVGAVPAQVTIIGDEAARNNRIIYGIPNVAVQAGDK